MTIQSESDLHPLQKLALQDFSYSRLSTFEQCELKYFYSYILKEPRVFGPPATLGNIIHEALEFTLESNQPINAFDLMQNYKDAIPSYDPEGLIPDAMLANGEEMLQEFIDRHKDELFHIIGKEVPFSLVVGNARFNGYIDLLMKGPDGNIQVIDYKSGAREVAEKNVPSDLQLGLYALIVRHWYPHQDTVYAELYYLKSGRRKGHLFTTDDLLQVEARLSELVHDVLTKMDFKATSENSACYWCDYAKNGVCATGARRVKK